jgi:DNA-binding SARP family transcriptional activator
VAWQGQAVPGDRVAALLATLASRPEGVTDGRLIQRIWDDDEPANPTKALQVLVSRVRTTLGADSVERYDGGYRLGVPADDVDALLLRRLTREAVSALESGDAPPSSRPGEPDGCWGWRCRRPAAVDDLDPVGELIRLV